MLLIAVVTVQHTYAKHSEREKRDTLLHNYVGSVRSRSLDQPSDPHKLMKSFTSPITPFITYGTVPNGQQTLLSDCSVAEAYM